MALNAMDAVDELSSKYWISLVGKLTSTRDVNEVLVRHDISLHRVRWIHGGARAGLRSAGVYMCFWKAGSGRDADVQVHGIEFATRGMRGGQPYQGSLPHDIDARDSIETVKAKLDPVTLAEVYGPGGFQALLPDHRLVVLFDAKGRLKSCAWFSNLEHRRIASNAARTH